MTRNSIAITVFENTEGHRDPSVRYFTGHPGDALLLLTITGHAVLCPWDEPMARKMASVDIILPYNDFGRHPITAVQNIIGKIEVPPRSRIEISSATPYPIFLRYVEALMEYDVLCREEGSADEAAALQRSVKDGEELAAIRKACEITDNILLAIEKKVHSGKIKTEADVALLIEREARAYGGEGTGFATIAAGPSRSFGIHAFPAWSEGTFPGPGLSILDFGVVFQGYTSDVSLTIAQGELSPAQEKMIQLVEKAYKAGLELYTPGTPTREASLKVDEIFRKARKSMPHSLGHGIGLEAHEGPAIRNRIDNVWTFAPGMVVTLEPGLYDPKHGGCRLENDILITETGHKELTHSKIIRL